MVLGHECSPISWQLEGLPRSTAIVIVVIDVSDRSRKSPGANIINLLASSTMAAPRIRAALRPVVREQRWAADGVGISLRKIQVNERRLAEAHR